MPLSGGESARAHRRGCSRTGAAMDGEHCGLKGLLSPAILSSKLNRVLKYALSQRVENLDAGGLEVAGVVGCNDVTVIERCGGDQ